MNTSGLEKDLTGSADSQAIGPMDEEMVLVLEDTPSSPGTDERITKVTSAIQPRVWNTGVLTTREPE